MQLAKYQYQASCLFCLAPLRDPVTIPCGHGYCINCCWKYGGKTVYSCPQCRKTFTPKPAVRLTSVRIPNLVITSQNFAGPGDVECDVCTGRKCKAVKSCLVCLESYCQTHFERHEEFHSGRHKMTEASGQLKQMICSKHNKQLEIFCRTDQCCICYLCTMDEHRNHDTVAAVAERTEKQRTLEEKKREFNQSLQEKEKRLKELKDAVQSHKSSAQTAVEDSERIFTELIQSIERRRSEVTQIIRDREKTEVSRAEGLLKKLEQEIQDMKKRNTELEKILHTDDHIRFLQTFQPFSSSPDITDRSIITFNSASSFGDVVTSVTALKQKLESLCEVEMQSVSVQAKLQQSVSMASAINRTYQTEPKTRNDFLQYFLHLSLDQNTANEHICLSEGNTVATDTDIAQFYPEHPDRFDIYSQVLCKESVSGRCYWEVELSGSNSQYDVGVAVSFKSVSRKGQGNTSQFGCNNQSWKLSCSKSSCSFWHNNNPTNLCVPLSSRIGVYVDQRAGILSLFSVSDTMSLIHQVQTTFTEPLYPGFWVGFNSKVKLCHLQHNYPEFVFTAKTLLDTRI